MAKEFSKTELFESVPIPKAIAALAVPTIISQLVTLIYNLADTFFIGRLANPYMVAAVSLTAPWFNLLAALGNLFGMGGSSLISRMLGSGKQDNIKYASAFSIWGGMTATLLFSVGTFLWLRPLLNFLGASPETYGYAEDYLWWTVTLGGVPTVLGLMLGHLLRSEGHARQASRGMMFGGILNVALDPIFIFGFGLEVAGAAIATCISNVASVIFFLVQYARLHKDSYLSLHPKHFTFRFARPVLSVGIATATGTLMANIASMVMVKLSSGYGDIPLAAYGVVRKIDMFPFSVAMGMCQGFMPLVGYNFAARNFQRMKEAIRFAWKVAAAFAVGCVAVFSLFAPQLLNLFIPEPETSALGTVFLRIACLALPFITMNFLVSYTLQSMGKGIQSTLLISCRQGLCNIPMMLLMNHLFGLYGLIWTQLVVDAFMIPISLGMYRYTMRRITGVGSAQQK
ncbi:MAG: MATE family efflux transporter [Ruminococcaceae bacterium]|nr:MATE family efflux transporter [Oscillospiraceae bacterium]